MTAPRGPVADPQGPDIEERRRLRQVYRDYLDDPRCLRRWAEGPGAAFMRERKWSLLERALRGAGIDLRSARILDIGSGSGQDSARFMDLGAAPSRLVLLDQWIEGLILARTSYPGFGVIGADAARLPFRDATFTVVYQSTMLSSVLDGRVRRAILAEIGRVLEPGGIFLSYDTRYPNPWNRRTRPLRGREVSAATPGWRLSSRSATAVPQMVRLLAPRATWACRILEAIPLLRCHLVIGVVKPGGGRPA